MKKLSLIDKLIFIVNSILAAILLLSYLSYFISPNNLQIIASISLSIPALIVINLLFSIYWLVKLKKQFLISAIVILIGYQYLMKFYSFNEKKVMTYNIRMFNKYKWINEEDIDEKIIQFIEDKKPDILCLQEYAVDKRIRLNFPYKYITSGKKKSSFGQAIYSKYKIINKGSLNFSNSNNNAIFVDVLKNKDTVRIYNVHLESLKINPKAEEITQENTEKVRLRVEKAFKIQANQVELIKQHQSKFKHKSVLCGDFNNTAFSWAYYNLKEGRNDAFEEAGSGFGKSYEFHFPLRIDFILPDKSIQINNFKTYKVKYSDHYPIMARITL